MRILIVEDETDLADAVAIAFRREGYAVDVAYDGNDAWTKLLINAYDLVVLDLNLPGIDGIELCHRIRSRGESLASPDPRVLMLTARDTVQDRVAGLDIGADDYLVKPFALQELTARVRALLRRPAGPQGAIARVGALELDDARHEARYATTPIALTTKEFALLRYFMSRPGEAISQEDLLEHVWDEHADPFSASRVRVAVMGLRRKLADAGAGAPIETIPGRGYRLIEDA